MYIDCHVHLALNGDDTGKYIKILKKRDEESRILVKNILKLYKSRGITKLRDGGDSFGLGSFIREVSMDEEFIYRTPIKAIYKSGHYGKFLGESVTGNKDFKKKFTDILKDKPDFAKIIYTGILSIDEYGNVGDIGFTDDEIKYIIDFCHNAGLKVMLHANSAKAVLTAVKYGVDTVEHGYYIDDEVIHAMKENSVIWIPTLAPFGNMINQSNKDYIVQRSNIIKIFNRQLKNIKKANKLGVKIAIGSDAGSKTVQHGRGFFDELIYLYNSGITKDDLKKIIYVNGNEVINKFSK